MPSVTGQVLSRLLDIAVHIHFVGMNETQTVGNLLKLAMIMLLGPSLHHHDDDDDDDLRQATRPGPCPDSGLQHHSQAPTAVEV